MMLIGQVAVTSVLVPPVTTEAASMPSRAIVFFAADSAALDEDARGVVDRPRR